MDQTWFQLESSATPLREFSSLFQQSYDLGTLPYAWKLANICAFFKKGRKADPKNCKPLSRKSLASKVMEHIVSWQISRHLSKNRIICPHRHGFQRGLSCETQIITVIYEWASVLNVHGQVDVEHLTPSPMNGFYLRLTTTEFVIRLTSGFEAF